MLQNRKKRANKHIRKNDIVVVISGKNKGKTGKVLKIDPTTNCAVVEKVNFIKKHQRPTSQMKQGGIIEKEGPIKLDNMMLLDSKSNKPSRVRIEKAKNGKKRRVLAKSGEPVEIKK